MTPDSDSRSAAGNHGLAALRFSQYVIFLIGKLLAYSSHHMVVVAVGYQIYDITGDAMTLAYISLVLVCPTFFFALVTGYASDRIDRRTVLIGGYAGLALASGALWLISGLDLITSWWVYVALVINGTARAFLSPAVSAIIPNLVPREVFANAVSWNTVTTRATQIGGPALGGIIYLWGPEAVYATATIACLAGTLGCLWLAVRRPEPSGKPAGLGELLAGVVYVYRSKVILGVIIVDLIIILTASITAVLPIIAKDVLEVGPTGAGILRSAIALGGLSAALIMTRYPITRHAGQVMFIAAVVLALTTVAIGFSTSFLLSIVLMAIVGMADMINVNIRHTLVQIATPDNMRGRVTAVAMVAASSSTELGGFRAGALAAVMGIVPSIVVGGVVGLVLVALCWKLFPELARIQRYDRLD